MKKSNLLITILMSLTIYGCNSSNANTNSTHNKEEEYYEIFDGLYVNKHPGIYSEGFDLEFKLDDKNAKLYYTLNSNKPIENEENLYTEPIYVDKKESKERKDFPLTTSVDGILMNDHGGKVQSQNYINNIQKPSKYNFSPLQKVITINYIDANNNSHTRSLSYIFGDYDIPVVSLSMPYKEWFGSTGLYNNIRIEYEKRANLEYIDPEQDEYFYRNTQVKIGGNWTVGYPQRTLNLNFNKDEFGKKQEKVKANIFKGRKTQDGTKTLDTFTRLRLHNGGNCFENYTGINDAIMQEMMYGTNCATTGYRPCIVYLNGEYWGLYSIREHYKDVYFSTNYGVNKDTVAIYDYKGEFIFNDGDDSDFDDFFIELNTYLNNEFKNDNVYYDFIDKYIDVDSFIDVMIAHSFGCNRDFVGNNNNLRAWRTTVIDENNDYADGKLRFALHDADFVFTDASYWNFLEEGIDNSYVNFRMFRKLLRNKNFREAFYDRAEELVSSHLSAENGEEVIDRMIGEIEDYKLQSNYRWGIYYYGQEINHIKEIGLAGWNYEINYAKDFIYTRCYDEKETVYENGNINERNYLEAIEEVFNRY